jgi:hypothetical protein
LLSAFAFRAGVMSSYFFVTSATYIDWYIHIAHPSVHILDGSRTDPPRSPWRGDFFYVIDLGRVMITAWEIHVTGAAGVTVEVWYVAVTDPADALSAVVEHAHVVDHDSLLVKRKLTSRQMMDLGLAAGEVRRR